MKWSGYRSPLLAALVAAALAGCASNTVTTPTPPTQTTETFTGTLAPSSTVFQGFIAKAGQVTVTLTVLSPALTGKLAMAVGVYDSYSLSCGTSYSTNYSTGVNSTVVGLATVTTSLCVSLADLASVIPTGVSEGYTITVTHY